MKKILTVLFFALIMTAMAVCFTGCTDGDKTGTETMSEPAETPNDISDFEYTETNGGIKIKKYIGSSTNVVIPETINDLPVTELSADAFMNFRQLEYLSIPSGIKTIDRLSNFVTFEDNLFPELKKIRLREGIEEIGDNAFVGCRSLKEINLPSTLRSIGFKAFYGCAALTDVALPSSLTSLGQQAFDSCISLKYIKIPASVDGSWGMSTFNRSGLERVDIEEGITVIPSNSFSVSKLKSVVTPSSVREIGDFAFYECSDLAEIKLNEGIVSIGNQAFAHNKSIEELVIPASVKTVDEIVINVCEKLKKLVFKGNAPENFSTDATRSRLEYTYRNFVVHINENASGFTFPLWNGYPVQKGDKSAIKLQGDFAFVENSDGSLTLVGYYGSDTDVVVPETVDQKAVTSINVYAFRKAAMITSVTMPDTVTSLDESTFAHFNYLCKVVLSKKLTEIKRDTFKYSAITEIVVPGSVESMSLRAFNGCKQLEAVRFEGDAPRITETSDNDQTSYVVYYHKGASGFAFSDFNGHDCKEW